MDAVDSAILIAPITAALAAVFALHDRKPQHAAKLAKAAAAADWLALAAVDLAAATDEVGARAVAVALCPGAGVDAQAAQGILAGLISTLAAERGPAWSHADLAGLLSLSARSMRARLAATWSASLIDLDRLGEPTADTRRYLAGLAAATVAVQIAAEARRTA